MEIAGTAITMGWRVQDPRVFQLVNARHQLHVQVPKDLRDRVGVGDHWRETSFPTGGNRQQVAENVSLGCVASGGRTLVF